MITIKIPETRGSKRKYDFDNFAVGEMKSFKKTTSASVINSANGYAKRRNLNWKFKVWKEGKTINIVRIK